VPGTPGTASSANTMHVGLRKRRKVVADHVLDLRNIKASRDPPARQLMRARWMLPAGNVGGNEAGDHRGAEGGQSPAPAFLRELRVQ
jgi:hypothetical protein